MALDEIMGELEPRKRTALDGRTWWVAFNRRTLKYSTIATIGKYRTRRECAEAIATYTETRRFLFA